MLIFIHQKLYISLLILHLDGLQSLELIDLRVPTHVAVGTRATMSCRWALGPGDVLYSVKWYKDGKEFFRHVPRDMEPRRKFLLPGVDVEVFNSSASELTLAPADTSTGGRYSCEVSGEGPRFHTVSKHAEMMTVIPSQKSNISGVKPYYHVGDYLNASCTVGRYKPTTELTWYVNKEPVSADLVMPLVHSNMDGVISSRIQFKIQEHLMGTLNLKCVETFGSVSWLSADAVAIVRPLVEDSHTGKENVESAHSTYATNGNENYYPFRIFAFRIQLFMLLLDIVYEYVTI